MVITITLYVYYLKLNMNKLNNEINRLEIFLLKTDKVIDRMLDKDGFDTQDLSTLMGIRGDILQRIEEIHRNQKNTEMWERYKYP